VHVAEGLPGNAAVDIVEGRYAWSVWMAEDEPAGTPLVRDAVAAMLATINYPELLAGGPRPHRHVRPVRAHGEQGVQAAGSRF
jgi:hypothetical protein